MEKTLENGFGKIINQSIKARMNLEWADIVKGRDELQALQDKYGFGTEAYKEVFLQRCLKDALEDWSNEDFTTIAKKALLIALNAENIGFCFSCNGCLIKVEADMPGVCFSIQNREYENFHKTFNVCEIDSNFEKAGLKIEQLFQKAKVI